MKPKNVKKKNKKTAGMEPQHSVMEIRSVGTAINVKQVSWSFTLDSDTVFSEGVPIVVGVVV